MKKLLFLFFLSNLVLAQGQITTSETQKNGNSVSNTSPTTITASNGDYASTFISLSTPYTYRGIFPYINSDLVLVDSEIDKLPHNYTLLNSFPLINSSVSVLDVSTSLEGSYVFASVSSEKRNYVVIYDHIIATSILVNETLSDNSKGKYNTVVGVSVRLVAKFTSKKNGLKITNLFQLGVNAEKDKLDGKLEVHVIGCHSQKIQAIIPVTSDLNPTSIEQALQAVATIKSHIFDKETVIIPCVLGFTKLNKNTDGINVPRFISEQQESAINNLNVFKRH